VAFAYFVVALNGGSLVVGDHEHHESGLLNATPHFAQLAYLAVAAALPLLPLGGGSGSSSSSSSGSLGLEKAVSPSSSASSCCSLFLVGRADLSELFAACTGSALGASPPVHDKDSSSSSSSSKSSKSSTGDPYALPRAAVAVAVAAHLLRRHSVEHPFLVADNRHFPFYVWRKVLHHPGRPWLKWALAPLYVAVAYLVAARLLGRGSARSSNSSRSSSASSVGRISSGSGSGSSGSSSRNDGGSGVSRLWLLIWFVASALVLVPSPLLEPRYFTTAVMVAHAHAPPRPSWKATAATGALFAACNAAVLGLFLLRPFQWPDGSTARFMW
jgi:hypothetical protein